ncbi:MAG: ParA family protein [Nitrospirota bacterium]
MKHIIAITNQKGGVGKTTSAINISAALATCGNSVLLIDLDPQANATSGVSVEPEGATIYECLIERALINSAILPTCIHGLSIIPSKGDLVGAEIEVSNLADRESILKTIVGEIQAHDFVIIDCPPAFGLLTINALVAASALIVPVQCEYYAMEGLGRLMGNIDRIRDSFNPDLDLEGILLTMYDSRINLSRQVQDEIRGFFKEKVFQAVIPRNVALAEAPSHGKPVLSYNAASSGAKAYLDLAKEILANGKESIG